MAPLPAETPGTHQPITTPSPVFTLSETFHNHKNYQRGLWSQCQRRYWGHGHSVTSNILTTLQEVHSFTRHSSKHPPKEECITPKSTNATATTSQPTRTKPSTATLQITKLPNLPEIHLHHLSCHFHLPHQNSSNHLNKLTCLHTLSSPTPEILGIIPQRPREMTIRMTF